MREFADTTPQAMAPGDDWSVLRRIADTTAQASATEEDWRVLHGAVLARLTDLAGQSRQREVSAGLLECVQALRALQALQARSALDLRRLRHDGAPPPA